MTTALRITATIFLALAGTLYHFSQDFLSFTFTALAILILLASLFTHQKETKKEEISPSPINPNSLAVSNLHHPDLRDGRYSNCVLWCSIVNTSGQMVTINKVLAFGSKNELLPITWSNRINELGNPLDSSGLIGIKDTASLYLRHNHGTDIFSCKLEIYHSLSGKPIVKIFDEYVGWD